MSSLALTPRGHLLLNLAEEAVPLTSGLGPGLETAFGRG